VEWGGGGGGVKVLLYLDPDPVEVCPNERTDYEDGDLEGPEYEAKVPDLQTLLHSLTRIERGLK
jgi:hypothetical protein